MRTNDNELEEFQENGEFIKAGFSMGEFILVVGIAVFIVSVLCYYAVSANNNYKEYKAKLEGTVQSDPFKAGELILTIKKEEKNISEKTTIITEAQNSISGSVASIKKANEGLGKYGVESKSLFLTE